MYAFAGLIDDPAESLRQSKLLCESEGGRWYDDRASGGGVGCVYSPGNSGVRPVLAGVGVVLAVVIGLPLLAALARRR